MEALWPALAGLLGKITDPVVIVLLVLLFGSEWMRITQSREERADRKLLVEGLNNMTSKFNDGLQQIKNALSALTGRPLQ